MPKDNVEDEEDEELEDEEDEEEILKNIANASNPGGTPLSSTQPTPQNVVNPLSSIKTQIV